MNDQSTNRAAVGPPQQPIFSTEPDAQLRHVARAFPRVRRHLGRARRAFLDLQDTWHSTLTADAFDDEAHVEDGVIRISIRARWTRADQRVLTDLMAGFVGHLRDALDALVRESVAALSVLERTSLRERDKFFPIAQSPEQFRAFLDAGCLNGVAHTQMRLVAACQPFHGASGDDRADDLRAGLGQLAALGAALENGAQVDAWVTPGEPQVTIGEPVRVRSVRVFEPGALGDAREVAQVVLDGYAEGGCPMGGEANTTLDLCIPGVIDPGCSGLSIGAALARQFDVVAHLAYVFAALQEAIPGSRRVVEDGADGEDLAPDADAFPDTRSDITLLVETDDGVIMRRVAAASPLRLHDRRGKAAEVAIQDAAATWGMPDFVLFPAVERKGSGVREIGDGLLVAGGVGAIVQVKAREGDPGTEDRESRWVQKNVASAAKQVDGTARRLRSESVRMTNGRGRSVRVDGAAVRWVGAIVIDHPAPPMAMDIPVIASNTPHVVILRQDWEFLFDQLRSTFAVISYLLRVAGEGTVLGGESVRYFDLATADGRAAPGVFDREALGAGVEVSAPVLPMVPGYERDEEAHAMYRFVLEDIATSPLDPAYEDERQRLLGALDSLYVAHRTELGRMLLDALSDARRRPETSVTWRLRTYKADTGSHQLGFGVTSQFDERTQEALAEWLMLRHHERCVRLGMTDLTSIGVVLTPRPGRPDDWITTLASVAGDTGLDASDVARLESRWSAEGSSGI